MCHDRFHQRVHHRCGPAHNLKRGAYSFEPTSGHLNTSIMEQYNAVLARIRSMLTNAKLPLALFIIRVVLTGLNVLAQHRAVDKFELQRF